MGFGVGFHFCGCRVALQLRLASGMAGRKGAGVGCSRDEGHLTNRL